MSNENTVAIFLSPENEIKYFKFYGDLTEFDGVYINSAVPDHLDTTEEEYEGKENELAQIIQSTIDDPNDDNKPIELAEFKLLIQEGANLIEIGWLAVDDYREYLDKYPMLNDALVALDEYEEEIDSNTLLSISQEFEVPVDVLIEIYGGE